MHPNHNTDIEYALEDSGSGDIAGGYCEPGKVFRRLLIWR